MAKLLLGKIGGKSYGLQKILNKKGVKPNPFLPRLSIQAIVRPRSLLLSLKTRHPVRWSPIHPQ